MEFTQSFAREFIDRAQMVITASFLGVGAPEAVLVGVVALVVFGPKGLAEVRAVLSDSSLQQMPNPL